MRLKILLILLLSLPLWNAAAPPMRNSSFYFKPDTTWSAEGNIYSGDTIKVDTTGGGGSSSNSYAIRYLVNSMSYPLESFLTNKTDGTHSFTSNVGWYSFDKNIGDSIIFDSLQFKVTWGWDGTPDNTDTLVWLREQHQYIKVWHNTVTFTNYQYDTIIGTDPIDTLTYTIILNNKYASDEIVFSKWGWQQVYVNTNNGGATSVDVYMTTPLMFFRYAD